MNNRQRFWKAFNARSLRQRQRKAAAIRHRRIWCEVLEPRLALAAPVAVNDGYALLPGAQLSINAPGVIANDRDVDGDSLSALIVAGPARGVLALASDGAFTYKPSTSFWEGDSFTYRVSDGTYLSNPATVWLLVDCDCNPLIQPLPWNGPQLNTAPVAVNDAFNVAEDTPLSTSAPGVIANDTDPNGDALTALVVSNPPRGTLSLNANGTFQYLPAPNFHGAESFTYRLRDSGGLESNLATVTINVAPVNDAPLSINDAYQTVEDTVLSVPLSQGVLTNDSDVDAGDTLTAALIQQPFNGTVALAANGSFTYTPVMNFHGLDSFTYRASDGTLSSLPATVTIHVAPVNDFPFAANDNYSISEDTPLVVSSPGLLLNDMDIDGDVLTAQMVSAPPASHGVASIAPSGSFTFTPAIHFHGQASFTYRVSDIMSSSLATVTINITPVNDAPQANNNTYTLMEDTPLSVPVPGVLLNDFDIENDLLTALAVTQPARGTLTLNANGGFQYVPNINFRGIDSFTYRASDGALTSGVATVTLDVRRSPEPPIALHDAYSMNEDSVLAPVAPGVLANDSDDLLTAMLVSGPWNGMVSFRSDGSFTYTPPANFFGTDSFTYRGNDGAVLTNIATVTITVAPVNDAPVANNNNYSLPEDTPLHVTFAQGVLMNDTDVDGVVLSAQLVTGPALGNLLFNSNGSFTYTPIPAFHGVVSFTYRATDGVLLSNQATVSLNVVSCQSCFQFAVNDTYTALRNTVLNIAAPGVLTNDADLDTSITLTAHLVAAPSSGTLVLNPNGSFTYTPANNFLGLASFTYRNSDGQTQSNAATVTINVTGPQNSPPVVISDAYNATEDTPLTVPAPGILGNDLDANSDQLRAVLVSGPTRGTVSLNVNGSFVYTPAANFHGLDSFRYCANDGQADSGIATVTINVIPVPDAPVARDDTYSVAQNVQLTVAASVGVLANDTDADSDPLTPQLIAGPARGTLTLNTNGSFLYLPNLNAVGIDSFTYRATDGALFSNVATVRLQTGDCAGCEPTAVNDAYTVPRNTALNISAPGVLANDIDASGSILNATLVAPPANGTLILNPIGSFSYTPAANFTGLASFTYRSSNGQLQSNLATVTINVTTPPNSPPLAVNDWFTVPPNMVANIAAPGVLFNDGDVDGDPLTLALITPPQSGTLTISPNGGFTYVPAVNFLGQVSFTYRLSDGIFSSNVATVTLSVCPGCSDPPQARSNSYTVAEDTPLIVPAATGVLANDVDFGGAALTAQLLNAPANGSLSLHPSGSFTYTPPANYFGVASFTYRASNGQTVSNVATVTINVTPVNDIPIATADFFTAIRNTPLTIVAPGVLANDIDVDGDALLAVLVTSSANGVLSLAPSGRFTYTSNQGFTGIDSFTYRANDGQLTGSQATVLLNILPPCTTCPGGIQNDAYTLTEDVPLSVPAPGVLANDGDFEDLPVIAQLVAGPTRGTLSLHPSGSFVYTPNLNSFGIDSFTYRAFDGQASSNLATVTLTVTPVNDPPVAVRDNYYSSDYPLTISIPGLLANDLDIEADSLTAALVTAPASGTLTLNSNGSFTYVPENCFNGVVSFTYRVSDGRLESAPATVSISISTSLGAPPVSLARDSYSISEDTPLNVPAPGILANDYVERCLPPLSAHLVIAPTRGTLTLNANGSFVYIPQADYFGADSFVYGVSNGLLYGDLATVTLTIAPVNDPPVATNDAYTVASCGTTLTIGAPGVLANDFDVDGNPLTAALVSGPFHGTLSLSATGAFTYTPFANFVGFDSFSYRASDGSLSSNLATVTLTTTLAPDIPPVASADSYTAAKNTPLIVGAPGVLANDQDDCGPERLTAQLVAGPTSGTLTLEPGGRFQYIPAPGFAGIDSFTYRATDGRGLSSPPTLVRLTIAATTNQPPIAIPDRYATSRNIELSGGVLGNDLDPEGLPLGATLVAGPASGALSLAPSGAFTYMPDQNFTGADSFTYRATDGVQVSNIATVSITVAAPGENTPPAANHDQFYAIEDNSVSVFPGVLTNDTDAERSPLTAILVQGPEHGTLSLSASGSFSYQPAANFYGLDRFSYRASDGTLTSDLATASILVFNLNDRPAAAPDSYTLNRTSAPGGTNHLAINAPGPLANDSDLDGDSLTAVLVAGPAHGTFTLSPSGGFFYMPRSDFAGTDSFTYQASDGVLVSPPAVVTITVIAADNVPPSFAAGANVTATDEAGPQSIANWATQISAGPASEANQTVIFLVTLSNSALFSVPPAISSAGTLTFTPAPNASGAAEVTVRLQDSGSGPNTSPPQTFSITINKPRPLHNTKSPLDVNADGFITPLDFVLIENYLKDHPPGPLPPNAVGPPFVDVNGDGLITLFDRDLVYRHLPPSPPPSLDGPVASSDSYTTVEDQPLSIRAVVGVLTNDIETYHDVLTARLVAAPDHGVLSLNADGSFLYTPSPDFNGADSFTYVAHDGAQASDHATVTINVTPVNDPPSFTLRGTTIHAVDEGQARIFLNWATPISAGAPDEANQTLTFIVTPTSTRAFAFQPEISPNGTLFFKAAPNIEGIVGVRVQLQDSGDGSNTSPQQSFSIAITKWRPGHNARDPLDTNDSGKVTPLDAVLVINLLNSIGAGPVSWFLPDPDEWYLPADNPCPYPDVNGDRLVSPMDAILIINRLNSAVSAPPAAEGESPSAAALSFSDVAALAALSETDALLSLLALDVAQATRRRRLR